MSKKLPTVWPLTPHTEAKHQLLKHYLGGWFPILSTWNSRIVFFDGFAGPGVYTKGQPGSPLVALDTLMQHNSWPQMQQKEFVFLFNEGDAARFAVLEQTVEDYKLAHAPWPENVKVSLVNDHFEDTVQELLDTLAAQRARLAPTFAFVDPFGLKDFSMDLLSRLLAFPTCELFVYFDFNTANRFATAGNIDTVLTALYGTDEYVNAPASGPSRKQYLHDLFQRQLQNVCNLKYVQSFEMLNETGHTGYYLFYGTRNVKGLQVMKDAMWKVAPEGDYRFSDRLAGQDVLFQTEVDTSPLQAQLALEFAGRSVTIEQLEEYVLVHTPYRAAHLKKLTLKPMQAAGLISVPDKVKRGTYPAGTTVNF